MRQANATGLYELIIVESCEGRQLGSAEPKLPLSPEFGIALTSYYGQADKSTKTERDAMYTIYGDVNSGNCYKVKLLAEQLALPYTWVAVDILKKETHSTAFLDRNPNGKIPVLETPDGNILSSFRAPTP